MKFHFLKWFSFAMLIMGIAFRFPVFAGTSTSTPSICSSSSPVCFAAPKEFSLMMDLCRDLIQSIRTIGPQSPYLGKYVHPNRFQGDVFTPPTQNIAEKSLTTAQQVLDFSTATTAIFSSPQQGGGVQDIFAGTLVLFKDSAFLRDLRTLQDIQALLTQKKYELGLGGGWFSPINDANRKKIQMILTAYKKKGLLGGEVDSVNIKQGILYNQVLVVVDALLSALQDYLSLSSDTDGDTLAQLKTSLWGGVDTLHLVLSPEALSSLDAQYACARGSANVCSKSFATFKSGAKLFASAGSSVGKGLGDFVKKITDATKRLVQIFSAKPSDESKRREQELLTAYYGNQVSTKKFLSSLTGFLSSLVSVSSENSTFPLKDMFQNRRSRVVDTQHIVADRVENVGNVSTTSVSPVSSFAGYLTLGLDDLLQSQHLDMQSVLLSDVKDFTAIFTILGKQITQINALIGTKDEGLLKTITASANLQCSQ